MGRLHCATHKYDFVLSCIIKLREPCKRKLETDTWCAAAHGRFRAATCLVPDTVGGTPHCTMYTCHVLRILLNAEKVQMHAGDQYLLRRLQLLSNIICAKGIANGMCPELYSSSAP